MRNSKSNSVIGVISIIELPENLSPQSIFLFNQHLCMRLNNEYDL